MTAFKSIMEITADEWLQALNLSSGDIPDAVIIEGSWWRQQRTEWRLGYLTEVRELQFPDMFWGRWRDKKVVFSVAYGAARSAELIHLFGILGVKLAVQIGTCGGLQSQLKPGDIILPALALCHDGVAHLYGAVEGVAASPAWLERGNERLRIARGHTTHVGTHLTWPTLFAQNAHMVEVWHQAGYLSVDMETATTFAVAEHFGIPAVSFLVVWDDLTRGRSFLDPLNDVEMTALNESNTAVFETALQLTEMT